MNKLVSSCGIAVQDIEDGATILVGGFTGRGTPSKLLLALKDRGVKDLTIVRNDASGGWHNPVDIDILIAAGQVKKVITCFAVFGSPKKVSVLEQAALGGTTEVELSPQGTLAERIRAGGSGIGAFYTPVGVGTKAAKGKKKKKINGIEMILEYPIKADFALIHAYESDTIGNLTYRMSSRNFNPIMATAGKITIAEVEKLKKTGDIDPDHVITPSIYVDRIINLSEEEK